MVAPERALPRMYPEVVEKIVPLSEKHSTLGVVAPQNFHQPRCPWVFVLVDSEELSGGEGFIDAYAGGVEVVSIDKFYEDAIRNLVSNVLVVNGLSVDENLLLYTRRGRLAFYQLRSFFRDGPLSVVEQNARIKDILS